LATAFLNNPGSSQLAGGEAMIGEMQAELQPVEVASQRPKSILIVDDDATQVEALARRFESLGYRTLQTNQGQHGIVLAESHHPDVVLLDLRLPDVTGFQVCEHLSSQPGTCDIPIIIVSAVEQADIVRRSRAAGCRYYLRKPYDPNSLLCLVEHALQDSDCWD
jgi:CheY-like chemotaxis protein